MSEAPDPRRQKYLHYVRKLANMFGLKDWVFEVANDGPADTEALASIYCPPGRKYGYIRLSQTFLTESPEERRLIILHELTHCHFSMADNFAKEHLLTDQRSSYATLSEYGIDGLSTAIVNLFPIPENL